ncbi:MAG: Hsp20/alpha crystallin family protein [Rickettsia endosymbiont of Ixodes persulcatus]|nr:Hsp20/alpha crystallin family protein [Rickettsia endosymbiont of Ixodes persulcatus]MCZ6902923.1 Hsp20/alpha crystallin family protein [Rickettsia endosymbiont of Ixodes persulcatus]MCZ6908527.1 Hsp20/alpha crystallin family protein [Rickettsia endosymbiont of Ixodes persulcatus]MCZ6910348.1 Hsp20/alpha crystallin family protein [Rickettsia endosymbiont of Ixodes persulcatus]MCZ6914137.1 Hsp20/alpha crystallin family protein [Rickettsia endosymbiont of Ixodes persulcatus]
MAFNLSHIRNKSELQNNSSKRSYIDDVFNNFFNEIASFSSSYNNRMLSPSTDIIENDSEYNLEMELPGVTQDNIDLKIDSNILTIEGKKEQSSEKKDHNYHMQERYYGSFYRSISLPSNIDEEHIEAKFNDGILSIKIPKKEQSKAKKIKVT